MMHSTRTAAGEGQVWETVIDPRRGMWHAGFGEILRHRELLFFLVWRDIRVRYRQTVLGVTWALVRPLLSMAVFLFVFHRLAGIAVTGVPYPLFVMAGIVVWTFFSDGVTTSSQSLLANTALITKVWFPRMLIPIAAVLRGTVDAAIATVLFVVMLAWYGHPITAAVLLLPLAAVWAFVAALGPGLWFTGLGVRYRDVAHALPFIVQLLFWVSPVGYPAEAVPAGFVTVFWCNPLAGVIGMARSALLGTPFPDAALLSLSLAVTLVILVTGAWVFVRMERDFADVI